MKKEIVNNIKYDKETGALKVLASMIASKKVPDWYKDKAFKVIMAICSNYIKEDTHVTYDESDGYLINRLNEAHKKVDILKNKNDVDLRNGLQPDIKLTKDDLPDSPPDIPNGKCQHRNAKPGLMDSVYCPDCNETFLNSSTL